jgi:hypothetical protein
LIDDIGADSLPLSTMLNLLDVYPYQIPMKGKMDWARWEQVLITTNVPHTEWFHFILEEQKAALERRIHCIIEMTSCSPEGEDPTSWTYDIKKGSLLAKSPPPPPQVSEVQPLGSPDLFDEEDETARVLVTLSTDDSMDIMSQHEMEELYGTDIGL